MGEVRQTAVRMSMSSTVIMLTIVAVTTLQGHSKIVQRCNTNSAAQVSEDSSELAAQQS
jgi:uncharacterized membrane protein affecting hemolysin expression